MCKKLALLFVIFSLSYRLAYADAINVQVEQIGMASEIEVASTNPLGAAIFIRDDKLWFVFDKFLDLNFSGLNGPNKVIEKLEHIKGSYTTFYFQIKNIDAYEITSAKRNEALVIKITPYDPSISPGELVASRKIIKRTNNAANSVSIQLYDKETSIVSFTDPFIGDRFFIVPEKVTARNSGYSFVDFKILPSISGVVVKSLNDSLTATIEDNFLNISSTSYLNISSGDMEDQNINDILDSKSDFILDLNKYIARPGDFNSNLSTIYASISSTYDQSLKSYKFLNLALFFLANGWYPEARSVFELIHNTSDIIDKSYKLKLLVAITYFLCHDFSQSHMIMDLIDIENVSMKDRVEVRFWRNLCGLVHKVESDMLGDKALIDLLARKVAKKIINHKNNFLSKYIPSIFNEICFDVIKSSLETNKLEIVQSAVQVLSASDITDKQRMLLEYYYGRTTDEKSAIIKFNECAQFDDHYLRSHCQFELLKLLMKTSQINNIQYVNGLQRIASTWRGDKFEIDVLETLASTYNEMEEPANAIRIWQMIYANYPNSYFGFSARTKASQAFIDYFKSPGNEKLDKLSFFYEFKNLIPLGDEGDDIIMQTASYMLDLDLVDQAIKVMEYQIEHRLLGISKERTINELSRVYTEAKKFEMAEKIIDDFTTFPFNMINPLIAERKYLYVNALIGSEQYQDAIALLYGDPTPEADELRSKAFFRLNDWENFNNSSEPYIYSLRYAKNSRLTESDYIKILRQNIVYFNNNQMSLLNNLYLDMKQRFKRESKNAEKNKIFYQIANELKDQKTPINAARKEKLQTLIQQITR